jgi:hypothetical protein
MEGDFSLLRVQQQTKTNFTETSCQFGLGLQNPEEVQATP